MSANTKSRIGVVTSTKMEKTVVVAVETQGKHMLYKKITRSTVKYKAHDEAGACRQGDKVRIVETRPLSKDKRWRVAEIVAKAEGVEVKPKEIVE